MIECLVCRHETEQNNLGLFGNGIFRVQFVPGHVCNDCGKAIYQMFVTAMQHTQRNGGGTHAWNIRAFTAQLERQAGRPSSQVVRDLLEDMGIEPGEDL